MENIYSNFRHSFVKIYEKIFPDNPIDEDLVVLKRDHLDNFDAESINDMVATIGRFNEKQGWRQKHQEIYDALEKAGRPDLVPVVKNYILGTMIALIHSEYSEALEGLRKNLMDDHLPNKKMVDVEIADGIIRSFDLADFLGADLGDAIVKKDEYNHSREDHKLENREKENGKKF